MKQELDELIGEFRSAQDRAVAFLSRELGIPRPDTNRDWVRIWYAHELQKPGVRNGVHIDCHGYGVELVLADVTIDFDWGENGEPDGFDAWRLYVFLLNNRPTDTRTDDEIQGWLDETLAEGELTMFGKLYFDPKRRAPTTLDA